MENIVEIKTKVGIEKSSVSVTLTSVKLQSLRDAHITYDGQITGKHYAWNRAGSIQEVDALDAPYLLEKRIKTQSCCAVNDTAIFQQID